MNEFTLIRKTLTRRKTRTILMLISITTAFLIYGLLTSFLSAFQAGDRLASADRLIVTSRVNFMQRLPISYAGKIARVEGVTAVAPVRWMLGYYREPKDLIPVVMVMPESYMAIIPPVTVTADQLKAFIGTRDGLAVGRDTAERFHWKVGDRIALNSVGDVNNSGGRSWDFVISAIYGTKGEANAQGIAGHYDYYNEGLAAGRDVMNWAVVKTSGSSGNERISRTIDEMFANSSAETKTQSESALGKAFLAQLGNIALIVKLVVGAAFFTILLIVGNTMVASMRERRSEIGLLKTLGFPIRRVFRLAAAEPVALAAIGAATGLCVAAILLSVIRPAVQSVLPGVGMTAGIALGGVALALIFGLVVALVPTTLAVRMPIAVALGRK